MYREIEVTIEDRTMRIVLNRPNAGNSINDLLLEEINDALDRAEDDNQLRCIMLEGKNGYFCTGMDFTQIANNDPGSGGKGLLTKTYMETLRKISSIPLVVISNIDGQVMAGGVGIVAASDYAVATKKSVFSLSEALWGLMPCMVMPYLMRRVGFQKAKSMTLSALPINAEEAHHIQLLDAISQDYNESSTCIRNYTSRIRKLEKSTIGNIKSYMKKMSPITREIEELAVKETSELFCSPIVINNISNYVKYKVFPWENK